MVALQGPAGPVPIPLRPPRGAIANAIVIRALHRLSHCCPTVHVLSPRVCRWGLGVGGEERRVIQDKEFTWAIRWDYMTTLMGFFKFDIVLIYLFIFCLDFFFFKPGVI